MGNVVRTPLARLAWGAVFKPQKNRMNPDADPKYSVRLLFEKDADLTPLKEICRAAVEDEWGSKAPKGLKTPFRDQGEIDKEGYVDGAMFITASTFDKPRVVDQKVKDIIDTSLVYPGCYVFASVHAYAYNRPDSKGVTFGLNNLQLVKDGEPLVNRSTPEDDFEPIAAAEGEMEEKAETADDIFG